MLKAARLLLLMLCSGAVTVPSLPCGAKSSQYYQSEPSSYQGVMSYPTFDERELDATLVKMHQSPVQEQLASSAKSGHPAGLTSKWLERLGDKCMILDMETDGVLVLAAQDPSIVGNKYYQGDDFASINGQSVHTMVLTPFDKHGKRIIIPDGVKVGLDEVTDPQELTELIRLASKLRQQRGDVGRPSTHTASRTPKTR